MKSAHSLDAQRWFIEIEEIYSNCEIYRQSGGMGGNELDIPVVACYNLLSQFVEVVGESLIPERLQQQYES